MATLILSAVGSAIGGPIGAAVGAIVGQQIDATIFAPKARQGPRLGELSVQTSSYGTAIPKIFGTLRVAGSVIWATDIKEDKTRSGGGKGRPKTETYSYSASFAVVVSARPIASVRRIWADGKLLRGAAGDFKTHTRFRVYRGGEDQPVDPLIASVEGTSGAPAYRGLAYAVFEDFQLAEYGNRIPSLTFEVEADAGPIEIGVIAEEVSDGEILAGATPALGGFAASGDSIRGALENLTDLASLSLWEEEGRLRLGAPAGPARTIARDEVDTRGDGEAGGRTEIQRRAADAIPAEVAIAYHEVDRDYQTGLQRASRGRPGVRAARLSVPAAFSAERAKSFAEERLSRLWAGRETAKVHLPWRRCAMMPATKVRIEGEGGTWHAVRWTLHNMVTTLELTREVHASSDAASIPATPGRPIAEPDQPHGPTKLLLFDLPIGDEPLDRPRLYAAAAGSEAGWRRAATLLSTDGGVTWSEQAPITAAATMGSIATALAPANSTLIDLRHSLEVELLSEAMWLESRSDAALVAGANLAVVGDELIQFGVVEPLGARKFRLSRLLRGRRGTERLESEHQPGAPFILVEREKLNAIDFGRGLEGAEAMLLAQSVGDDDEGVLAAQTIHGRSLRPPSPVHFRARRQADGAVAFSWTRRSRTGWSWLSGSDAPLGEEQELYRLALSGGTGPRVVEVASPFFLYPAAQQAEDGVVGLIAAELCQVGTYGRSGSSKLIIS